MVDIGNLDLSITKTEHNDDRIKNGVFKKGRTCDFEVGKKFNANNQKHVRDLESEVRRLTGKDVNFDPQKLRNLKRVDRIKNLTYK